MDYTTKTMFDLVEEAGKKYPENIAYSFMGKKTTYRTFLEEIEVAATALKAIGTKENDILCVAMPNVPQAVIFIYAANRIGATVNMIHPLSSSSEILDFLLRVKAKTILVLDQFYEKVASVSKDSHLEHIILCGIGEVLSPLKRVGFYLTSGRKNPHPRKGGSILYWKDFLTLGKDMDAPILHDNSKTALILHSGGTTGKVKGVCLSNYAVNASSYQMRAANPMLDPSDRFLSVMPIFHGNGLVIGVHTVLSIGARCVLIPRFTPETYAKDLLKNKCNYMSGVPVLFERLMSVDIMKTADLSFLKGIFCGADTLTMELEKRLNEFFRSHNASVPVRQGFGMTEGVVASLLTPYDKPKLGSIGKPLPGVKCKIVEPGTEKELPPMEVGEIVFSSDTNMTEYYENPEETALVKRLHQDGLYWIHSGDLGYMDEEGYFFFKGRIKRMIVINGYNVFPAEVENVIEKMEEVDRCVICGVQKTEGAQIVKAFIVLKPGVEPNEETKKRIIAFQREQISRYAVAKEIEFVSDFPKTKVGKIDYKALLHVEAL
ncbi:MAG: acyl--CoA ligase [Spirochaetales bacterium]|nr:acyl--CoA ligase [Candidatus Physcosoma equi]